MSKVTSYHLISYVIVICFAVIVVCCLLEILLRFGSLEKFLSPRYVSDVKSMRTWRKINATRTQDLSFHELKEHA